MISGRRSACSLIAWSLAAGLGLALAGCGEGTTPADSETKPASQPAPNPASAKTDKAKKDPRADMGIRELRESRRKKAEQP